MKKAMTLIAICLMSPAVYGGGFRVSLQGIRQAAMAHTSAHTRDASVAFFNPAGMAFIPEKLSVVAGGFGIATMSKYQNSSTLYHAETDNKMGTPFYFAASYQVVKNISVGVSITTPYGSSVDWGNDWAGSDIVQNISLKTFFIQPTFAVKFADWFSAGAGFIIARGSIELNRSLSSVTLADGSAATLQLKSKDGKGTGFNVGAYFKPTKSLDISLAYRSMVDMEVTDGEANFTLPASLVGSSIFPVAADTFSASLPLASEFTMAASYKMSPKWLLAVDVNFAGWQSYQSLDINFGQAQVAAATNPSDPTLSKTAKNFHYSAIYRIGTEYMFTDKFAGRLGYYYDQSPVDDKYWSPETPSTDNHVITGGLGYNLLTGLYIDLSGGYIMGSERDIDNTDAGFYGQTKSRALFFGLGLTYNH